MKQPSFEQYLIIGIFLLAILSSIPFKQEVEMTRAAEYTSTGQRDIEIGFGGPRITWVRVMCNRTAEIRFMYQSGVWISTENILVASFRSKAAGFNFNAEHTTIIVEITSEEPILVHVVYTFLIEIVANFFDRLLFTYGRYY